MSTICFASAVLDGVDYELSSQTVHAITRAVKDALEPLGSKTRQKIITIDDAVQLDFRRDQVIAAIQRVTSIDIDFIKGLKL